MKLSWTAVKMLPLKEIAIEYLCADIGRSIGLSIPEPILTLCHKEYFPKDFVSADQLVCFSSIDVDCPSLYRTCNGSIEILKVLLGIPATAEVSAFDEWILNIDRHARNILYDGSEKIYFIDHGLSLQIINNASEMSPQNQILDAFINYFDRELVLSKYSYIEKKFMPKIAKVPLDLLLDESYVEYKLLTQEELDFINNFLSQRIPYLVNILGQKFNIPQLELSI